MADVDKGTLNVILLDVRIPTNIWFKNKGWVGGDMYLLGQFLY